MPEKIIVAIHQPNFLPWLGYFHKMVHSDVFVFFDDVQYPRGKSFGNRVLIKSPNGSQWMTIPVSGRGEQAGFQQIKIDGTAWIKKTLRSLSFNYNKAPFFKDLFGGFEKILSKEHQYLKDLNLDLFYHIKELLNISTEFLFSSELCKGTKLTSEEKILFLLQKTNASHYISGSGEGSKRYINESEFAAHNIQLVWQHFEHPEYPQLFGSFIPNLSIIDLLFNCGKEKSLEILSSVKLDIT